MHARADTPTIGPVQALALDLGTTSVKLATLGADGRLSEPASAAAPRPVGEGEVREVDVEAYRAVAERLLSSAPRDLPLGVASQRSSFVLFERAGGRPVTPLISWQDRRAADWCERHGALAAELFELTGLPLSPHYAGPKLASVCERDAGLRAGLASGALLFGTLETYLAWHWSGGEHLTDLSMAARTQLADPAAARWSERALELFGVPPNALPTIAPTCGRDTALDDGRTLTASVADQAAGLLAVVGAEGEGTLVNLGTGAFVLRATGASDPRVPGFLTGPLLLAADGGARFALEGTINGGGATVDAAGAGPTELPAFDPTPDAFCLPDENGIGAPHWRALVPQTFSSAARDLGPADRRRIVLEGLVFRVREILEALDAGRPPATPVISGGLTHEPFLAPALAACLEREVRVLLEEQTTLLGAARLAAGVAHTPCASRVVEVPAAAAWLRTKYERWRSWVAPLLAS